MARVHSLGRTISMSASSDTSPRPCISTCRALHQHWACDDCRPPASIDCVSSFSAVPLQSRQIVPCASGNTGVLEQRGVHPAHDAAKCCASRMSGTMCPTCALSYAARVGIRANPSDPRHAPREGARVRPLLQPAVLLQGRCHAGARRPPPPSGRFFSRGDIGGLLH